MYKKFPLKKISKSKEFYLEYINRKNSLLQKQIGLRAKKLLRDLKTEANIENR